MNFAHPVPVNLVKLWSFQTWKPLSHTQIAGGADKRAILCWLHPPVCIPENCGRFVPKWPVFRGSRATNPCCPNFMESQLMHSSEGTHRLAEPAGPQVLLLERDSNTKTASGSPTQNRIGVGWTKQSQEPNNQPTSGEFLATLAPACVKDHPELLSRSTQSNDTSAVVREEISAEIGSTSVSCCG